MKRIVSIIKITLILILVLFVFCIIYRNQNLILNIFNYNNDYVYKETKKVKKNTTSVTYYPYYEMLSNDEKMVYNDILNGTNRYVKNIKLSKQVNVSNLSNILFSVLYDHPEIFWLDVEYKVYYDKEKNMAYSIDLEYLDNINNISSMRTKFNLEVNRIVNEAKKYEYISDQEKYVHDTLINKITYDLDTKNDQTAYGAIVNNKGVCVGYAKAFQLIMTRLNVPTYYIFGEAGTNDNIESHAWNLIYMGDNYYNVDLTWNDQKNQVIYKYYNISDQEILKNHKRSNLSNNLPKAIIDK